MGDTLRRQWVSYQRYALSDENGGQLAVSKYSSLGNLKRIETQSRAFRCSRRFHLKKALDIQVVDRSDGTPVASGSAGRTGTMRIDRRVLPFTINVGNVKRKEDRLAGSMIIKNETERPVVTLKWLEANVGLRKPFALGQAVFAESGLEGEPGLVLICLAFHLFAVALTPQGG